MSDWREAIDNYDPLNEPNRRAEMTAREWDEGDPEPKGHPSIVDSPRSASMLMSGALAHLDVIQPLDLRGPVRDILRAGIELCVGSRSLLGKPIQYTLDLAQAVMNAAAFQDDDEVHP